MDTAITTLTRASSSDSSSFSNIHVLNTAMDIDRESEQPAASTPPTSVSDDRSLTSNKHCHEKAKTLAPQDVPSGRPKRSRASVSTYNLKQLADDQLPKPTSRNPSGLSGRTLVERDDTAAEEEEEPLDLTLDKALNTDWELPAVLNKKKKSPARPIRRPSVKDRVKESVLEAGKKVASKAGSLKSVLGKRSRDMMESGKRRLAKIEEPPASPPKSKLLKELDLGKKGVLDEIDLDLEYAAPLPPRPTKRAKTASSSAAPPQGLAQPTGPMQKTSDGKKVKKWQAEGLYVGQDAEVTGPAASRKKKLQKKSLVDTTEGVDAPPPKRKSFISMPMYGYLDKQRDFTIPHDVFAPSLRKGDERPKDWHKLNRNRLVGEAKDLWEKQENLPTSACVCSNPSEGEVGCDYDCLNRVMQYECNDQNCRLPAPLCSNRAFAQLAARTKKGGLFDVGVEVVKTPQRGFGIRSCRSFVPGQIIMEYTGEIISEGECQRRMRELYADKACYYLMELERNLVIDGTKGSMARFINHSCEPNCEVRMVKVNGTPRMAVFAGESGIMTGEELTYDYNFDNFGEQAQKCYCGAGSCRGTLSRRLNAAEQKKMAKIEDERKRKAAEQAVRVAEEEQRKKKVKTERGSSWRGWLAVDDPETKARLREEKRLREEAEKNSVRARRLASRRGSMSAVESAKPVGIKKVDGKKRRRTTTTAAGVKAILPDGDARPASKASTTTTYRRKSIASTTGRKSEGGLSRVSTTVASQQQHVEDMAIDEANDDDDAITVSFSPASKGSKKGDDEQLLGEEEDRDGGDVQEKEKNVVKEGKEKNGVKEGGKSIRKRIEDVVKNSAVVGKGLMRQSTLQFAKLSS
jgi:histone-lysine N-methyltransferase ASH1L